MDSTRVGNAGAGSILTTQRHDVSNVKVHFGCASYCLWLDGLSCYL